MAGITKDDAAKNDSMNNNIIDQMLGDLTSFTTKTVEIDRYGHRWVFKAIGSGDHVKVIADSVCDGDRIARLFKLEIATLCWALVSVDGVVLKKHEKEYLFNHVAPMVIDGLADAYEEFRSGNERQLRSVVEPEAAQETAQGPTTQGPTTQEQTPTEQVSAAPQPTQSTRRSKNGVDADKLPSVDSVVPPSRG